jgi:hypothetical protein
VGVTLLSWLLAAMLAVSGALKARSGARLGIGVLPGAMAELLLGVGFAATPLFAVSLPVWAILFAVLLLLGSSIHYAVVLRRIRRRREESEAGRLAAYVRYLSSSSEDD